MARHTRRLPRNRQERQRATERAANLLKRLEQHATEARELEAAAREAKTKLQEQILRHVDARDLDITEMANATGISRQTIHRLVRARRPQQSHAAPKWEVGQRVVGLSRGDGTIEEADGPALTIRFDNGERFTLHAELAGIKPS